MENEIGANDLTLEELDELFKDDDLEQSPAQNQDTDDQDGVNDSEEDTAADSNADKSDTKSVETTKAFAKRLKESTDKARAEERDAVAKSLGYDSYAALQKANEKKLLEDKGLDPDEVSPVIEELVKKRLDEDPRMKELAELRKQQIEAFGKKELAEITELTGGEITSLAQLPKEVIDLWKKKGSLKSAYIELEGEKLITKIRSEQSKGSTSHLQNVSGITPTPSNKRPLTDEEKRIYKLFNPYISDEELNKKMYDK